MNLTSKIKTKEGIFVQKVDDETILLDAETQEYFSLNEIGSVFYELIEEKENLEAVLQELCECFSDVEPTDLKKDLLEFVTALKEKGLLFVS